MHDFLALPRWAIDRVMQRRGKLHVHDDMDPRRTALIVVDLQNGFYGARIHPHASPDGDCDRAQRQLAGCHLRATGGKVFWIKNTTNSDHGMVQLVRHEPPRAGAGAHRLLPGGCPGHALYPALEVRRRTRSC